MIRHDTRNRTYTLNKEMRGQCCGTLGQPLQHWLSTWVQHESLLLHSHYSPWEGCREQLQHLDEVLGFHLRPGPTHCSHVESEPGDLRSLCHFLSTTPPFKQKQILNKFTTTTKKTIYSQRNLLSQNKIMLHKFLENKGGKNPSQLTDEPITKVIPKPQKATDQIL